MDGLGSNTLRTKPFKPLFEFMRNFAQICRGLFSVAFLSGNARILSTRPHAFNKGITEFR